MSGSADDCITQAVGQALATIFFINLDDLEQQAIAIVELTTSDTGSRGLIVFTRVTVPSEAFQSHGRRLL